MKVRRKRLLKHCKEITGCDMIVALEPENLFYMTGFWGEAIGILEKNGKFSSFSDFLCTADWVSSTTRNTTI